MFGVKRFGFESNWTAETSGNLDNNEKKSFKKKNQLILTNWINTF